MTQRTRRLAAVAALALTMLVAGCITPSDPRLDDSDVDGWWSDTASSAVPPGSGPTAEPQGVPTPTAGDTDATPAPPAAWTVEAVPAAEGVLNAIWIGDGNVIVGGFHGPTFSAAMLVFDGTSWSVGDVPTAPGQVTGIAQIGKRLIAVGNELPEHRNGFIWESVDGRTWQTVRTIENAALYGVASGNGVIVATGARLDAEMNATAAAWTSTDGTAWKRAEVADGGGAAMGSVIATEQGFAATGHRPFGEDRPIWAATTATSWTTRSNDLSGQLLLTDIVKWSDRLAVVGAVGKSGDQHPIVATSPDGRHWMTTRLSTAEGYASAVIVTDRQLTVAGMDADRLTLWSLRNDSWHSDTIEESGSSISALVWDPERGLIAVGARDGRHAVWALGGGSST